MKKILALSLSFLLACGTAFATPITIDSYDKLVAKMNGTTTTFVDSSTANPKTITANGNATQLPIKFNKSAGFFNGTSDYAVIPTSTDFDLSGDFTIEFYVNILTRPANGVHMMCVSRYQDANNYFQISLYNNNSSTHLMPHFFGSLGGVNFNDSASFEMVTNTWYHVAIVRSGSTVYASVNGTVTTTGGTTTNKNITVTAPIQIGALNGGSFSNCWIKELRISNSARWTSNFTPSTTQYTTDANTVLLMHFDTPATSPLAPAIAFDGTGDYLSLADSADWDFAKGDFTVEGWFWVPAIPGSYTGWITSSVNSGGAGGWALWPDSGGVIHFAKINITDAVTSGTLKIEAARWNHVAVVRKGTGATDLNIYVNGVAGNSPATGNVTLDSGGGGLLIGRFYTDHTSYCMTGSVREVRVSDVARYTDNFTPSQTGFTVDANTKLYIKGDEDNGVTTFVDATGKTVTTAGNTVIKYTEDYRSCIFKDETGKFPYPVGSAKVDFFAIGSGAYYGTDAGNGYLSIAASDDWKLGTGNFTAEIYFRNDTSFSTANSSLIDCSVYGAGGWGIKAIAATTIAINLGGSSQNADISITVPTMITQTWYHVAMSRVSGVTNTFLNGTLIDSRADTYNYQPERALQIGSFLYTYNGTQNYQWTGRLDNVRISKGVARYTATFNPPDDSEDVANGKHRMLMVF